MKIALLTDIHGNSVALRAVLEEIEARGGADAYWVLGDIVAFGHDPVGVLEQLHRLPGLRCVRGNTDRYVFAGDRPPPTFDDAASDPALLPILTEVAGTLAWTQGALTATGWLPWLAALPIEITHQLPNLQTVLQVHAAPGCDDGSGITPYTTDEALQKALQQTEARLICVGHTHYVVDRKLDKWHVVNPGSVGLPRPEELRACYAMLLTSGHGYQVDFRQVEYDRQKIVAELQEMRHPGAAYIIRLLSDAN